MISAYFNDPRRQAAYITNVSVTHECAGLGIASALLGMCLAAAEAKGFGTVRLEVSPDNVPAVRLYSRAGFRAVAARGDRLQLMARELRDTADEDIEWEL
jgi:ribosomal protein S18 acetylase RimI-like enzyme